MVNRGSFLVPTSLREVSLWKGVALLVVDWGVIICACLATSSWIGYWFYPVAVAIIGARMMGLWALLHDGHHQLVAKPKVVNNFLTEFLIAWPLFVDLDEYARQHSAHHRHLGGHGDPNFALLRYPEFKFPMPKWRLASIFFLDLIGINFLRYRLMDVRNGRLPKVGKWIPWAAFAIAMLWFGLLDEFILFWIIPYITYFQFLIRLTLLADHCFVEIKGLRARSVEGNFLTAALLVPHNLNLHAEHHQYAHVPCYNISKLRNLLKEEGRVLPNSGYANCYTDVIKELTF